MAYYIILFILMLIIYKLRHRIRGFFAVGLILMVVIGLAMFLSDWYLDGKFRGNVATEPIVKEYDEFVEDPKGKVEEVAGGVKEELESMNQDLINEGQRVDDKYGFEKGKDKVWVKKEGSDILEEKETKKSVNELLKESKEGFENIGEEKPDDITDKGTEKIQYNQVENYIKGRNLTQEEEDYLRSVTPFNLGTYEVGRLEITTTKDYIEVKVR